MLTKIKENTITTIFVIAPFIISTIHSYSRFIENTPSKDSLGLSVLRLPLFSVYSIGIGIVILPMSLLLAKILTVIVKPKHLNKMVLNCLLFCSIFICIIVLIAVGLVYTREYGNEIQWKTMKQM